MIQTDHPRIDPHSINKAVVDQRIAEYRRAVRSNPHDEAAHYGLGVAYFNLGLLEEAADELSQASRLMPENPHIQTQLAVVYADLATSGKVGATESAWDRVNRALLLDLHHIDASMLKADLAMRRKDRATALALWRQVASRDSSLARPKLIEALRDQANDDLTNRRWIAMVATSRELAEQDPDAVRRPLAHFVAQHVDTLRSSKAWNRASRQRGARRPWFWQTLGLAISPVVVMMVGWKRAQTLLPAPAGKSVPRVHDFALRKVVDIDQLLDAAQLIASELERRDQIGPARR